MNPQIVTAIIIIAITCVLYIIDKLPVAVTTMLGLLAMVYSGILTVNDAFTCFVNDAVLLVIGMVIIVNSLIECGMGEKIGKFLDRIAGKNEKVFVIVVFLLSSFVSMFVTNASLVAMFMPFITTVAAASKGIITKKHTYLPLATGGLIGGTASLAGSTAPLYAQQALNEAGITMGFFDTFPVAICIIAVLSICYWLFLYDLEVKWFDFPEVSDKTEVSKEVKTFDKRKEIISIAVLLICIVLFILQPYFMKSWSLGLIAITGALILIIVKCIDGKKALRNMCWPALVTLAGALGIAKGFQKAGVGDLVCNWLEGMGTVGTSPLFLIALFMVVGYVLSLFMSNGALTSMLVSVAVPLAINIGINPIPLAFACVFGVSLAMATPSATTTITMVQVAGYRFKDYFRFGGLLGVIGLVVTWVALVVFYVI
ncbi:MAG: anion permease [Clostridia bacterium]|nr:anion permease [Clostridia bacterium]